MFGMIGRKLAHHGETFWIFLRGLDRERIRIGIPPRGWMDQGRVDAGLVHLVKQLLRRELRDLAVQAGRRHHGPQDHAMSASPRKQISGYIIWRVCFVPPIEDIGSA